MAQDLDAGSVTLLKLFKGEREYVSPRFQRKYVWGKVELDKLFEDIDEIIDTEDSTRFLGAIVTEINSSGMAFQPDSYWIIDGQQRLTSLYLTLLCIAIEAEENGDRELVESLTRQFLFNQDGEFKNRPKITPTLLDYRQFNEAFKRLSSVPVRFEVDYGDEDGAFSRALQRIGREVKTRCNVRNKYDSARARFLVATLVEKLQFVQIVLGDNQDPHQVFDSLNSTGVKLENKDLIRNIVFQKLGAKPHEAESLYRREWLPLEEQLGTRFDGYFFPFGLTFKPSATKSSLLSSLRTRWKEYEPTGIVADLRTYVPAYEALTNPDSQKRENFSDDQEVVDMLQRLYRMKVPSSTYTFLFHLLMAYKRGGLSRDLLIRNIVQIDSFLVRRAFAGYEPTGLHAVFKDMWSKSQGDPSLFVKEIDKNPTVEFPSDEAFEQHIRNKPLYGRRMALYVLMEYERALRGGDQLPADVTPTIDHIMPRELNETWKRIVSEEVHQKMKDTWANLVPLSLATNAEKGRKPWPYVRQFFMTETVFKTTKRLALENEVWGKNEIVSRSNILVQWAISRWPKEI